MKKILSGNEALALGACHAGVSVAAAYPGTPSTEILENIARFKGIYAEWSTNEQVAMEVALGASYGGVRALAVMKHVGLNVASDAFMAASTTGVDGGMVVISADDPGMHSSQNEQDNRHFAELAKVAMLEPADSQEAYELMSTAYEISERFDTPVLIRATTRICHSSSVVETKKERRVPDRKPLFKHDMEKYVMLPTSARQRRVLIEERMKQLSEYSETFPGNKISWGDRKLGVISSGVACQYAREVFPNASFLKLAMTYPLPKKLIAEFAVGVERVLVVEELDPFMETQIRAMGIPVIGKEFVSPIGELNTDIVRRAAEEAGLKEKSERTESLLPIDMAKRPPLLCAGCSHAGLFFVLSGLGQRAQLPGKSGRVTKPPRLIVTGDIGCYTLAAYPPLSAIDTCGCMGASIGQALGLEKAGVEENIVAVIGDSTFMHAGISGLVDAVYTQSKINIVILDNGTTAMTGHQGHPGTGVSASGKMLQAVDIEFLVRGCGVRDVVVVDAFDVKELRKSVKSALGSEQLSVIIVRGQCPTHTRRGSASLKIDRRICDDCGVCLLLGCPAIQRQGSQIFIDENFCVGKECGLCLQLCPPKAIELPQGAA